jgi:hypothetical protein
VIISSVWQTATDAPRSWQLIQKDCSIQPPFCTQQGNESDDCGVQVAWLYVVDSCLVTSFDADFLQVF